MSEPAIITVAREFYDNIFNVRKIVSSSNFDDGSRAINKIQNMKYYIIDSINDTSLPESTINFVRVMHMRGPQLIESIRIFDIINRYCHPDDCLEELKQVEILLKNNIA